MKNSRVFITSLRNEALGFILIVALWAGASLFYPAYIIPSPLAVFTDVNGYLPPDLFHHLGITLLRVLIGFVLAFFFGTAVGLIAFVGKREEQVNSLMLALQVMPGTILGVIFLLMFGIGNATPVLMVAFLTLPILAINTMNALSKRNEALEQYLVSLNCNRRAMMRYSYLPTLVPVLQSNISIGFSMAVKVVVLGEFIGSQDGLGFLLNTARIFFNMKEVFFYLVILLLFTLFVQALNSFAFSTFLRRYFYSE